MKKRILIIGATSAIASEVARLYAVDSAQLYLLGRNEKKLEGLSAQLGGSVAGFSAYDFLDTDSTPSQLQRAIEVLGTIDLALIAHGYLGDQLQSEADFAEADRVFSINFQSTVAQLIFLANYFENQGSGHIAVISSVAGDRGRPRNYTYGSAKMALTIYLQGLRSRLYPSVTVTTIKMGPVDTPMTASHTKNASFTSIPRAAAGVVWAVRRKKHEIYVPHYWAPIMWVVKRMPEGLFQRLKFLSGR